MQELELSKNVEYLVGKITFDKDAVKHDVEEFVKKFDNLVIVDEKEVKDFKDIRAGLNNVIKSLETKRKAIKAEFTAPLNAFEKDVKEIVAVIDDVNAKIDAQIKEYENLAKQRKKDLVLEYVVKNELTEYVDLIFKDEWLNKTYSITTIDDELKAIRNKIDGDLLVIENLCDSTIEKVELRNEYNSCLDIASVINNYNNRKSLIRKAIETDDENEYTITLEIKATKSQMEVIKDLLEKLDVEYRRVK